MKRLRTIVTSRALSVPAVAEDGLIARFAFDEEAGLFAYDSSGSGLDSPVSGWFAWAEGLNGNAIEFDGTNGSISLGQPASFNTNSFSISCWFRCEDALRFRSITSRDRTSNDRQFWLTVWQVGWGEHPDGVLAFRMSPVSSAYVDLTSDTRVDDGEWHFAAVTVDAVLGQVRLYLDGELVDQANNFSAPRWPNSSVVIGRDAAYADRHFKGLIDELRFYNRAISDEERSQLGTISPVREKRVVRWREVSPVGE